MGEAHFTQALRRATRAMMEGDGEPVRFLDRGGLRVVEIDLSSSALAAGAVELGVPGHAVRFLRQGSNPGARLELGFGGVTAHKNFTPGQQVRGGFKNATLKLGSNSARVGKAQLAVLSDFEVELSDDLLISAMGPVDLLGGMDSSGALTYVTVPEDTDPTLAYSAQTGAFDGSGWDLLRVFVNGAALTTADIHFFFNASWTGTVWHHATSVDGPFTLNDSPTTGFARRVFTVPWSGRGVGCPAVYNLLPGGLTGLGFCIQGIR